MNISACSILPGTVSSVTTGAVNAEVTLPLAGGSDLHIVITNASAQRLGLAPGTAASAVIQASAVFLGVPT